MPFFFSIALRLEEGFEELLIVFFFSISLVLREANFSSRNIGLCINQPITVEPALHSVCLVTERNSYGNQQHVTFKEIASIIAVP